MSAWLVLLFVPFLALAQTPAPALERETLSPRMHAREGETCHICYGRVTGKDVAYLANGQRVALHNAECCEGEFLKRPAHWMARLRPNDILFGTGGGGLAGGWIWVGMYALLGLVFGGMAASEAVSKGHPPVPWFFAGLFLPVAGYLAVALKPRVEQAPVTGGLRKIPLTREPLPCPSCGSTNHPAATICLGCGARLDPQAPSEVAAARGR